MTTARFTSAWLTLLLAVLLCAPSANGSGHRRALLIGIDDYSASRLPFPAGSPTVESRDWRDLRGAVNDVSILRELLVLLYGFKPEDIVTLTDQGATRAAILEAIDRDLVQPAAKGDVLFYYFAGHGSQVPNSRSDEADRLDESIIPADSRRGAPDIRDKELRRLFNSALDRGAFLTLLLDHCHSGSGVRSLPTTRRARGIRPASRDVRDGAGYGPAPDRRGALVLAATQDLDAAWEVADEDGRMHGAFTWALIRALRDAGGSEPAEETFLRAQARLRSETPYQEPVMAGIPAARLRPFLGARLDRRGEQVVVAVESVRPDGSVLLQGGWANGLSVGSELTLAGRSRTSPRLVVTTILGLGRSEARLMAGSTLTGAIRSGALVELSAWAPPPGKPLRVWWPQAPLHGSSLGELARSLRAEAARGVIDRATSPEDADYILVQRHTSHRLEFAWLRQGAGISRHTKGSLPERTAWVAGETGPANSTLVDTLRRLRRIHAWLQLQTPPGACAPYRLAIVNERGMTASAGAPLRGGDRYHSVLRPVAPARQDIARRYYYLFVIDSHGRAFLLYPRGGSVENRFPIDASPSEITLDEAGGFRIVKPFGPDTYILLSTDEPLPNPWILEWDGVRRTPIHLSPLEELFLTPSGRSSRRVAIPSRWSIERVVLESVPPRRTKSGG
jgi:hypothetical protein